MAMPNTHMNKDRPTLPDNSRIVLGVAKIPVPTMRLKINIEAPNTPICRRLSGDASKTFPSSGCKYSQITTSSRAIESNKEILTQSRNPIRATGSILVLRGLRIKHRGFTRTRNLNNRPSTLSHDRNNEPRNERGKEIQHERSEVQTSPYILATIWADAVSSG